MTMPNAPAVARPTLSTHLDYARLYGLSQARLDEALRCLNQYDAYTQQLEQKVKELEEQLQNLKDHEE